MHTRNQSFLRSRLILIGVIALIIILGAIWVFGPGRVSAPAPEATLASAPRITFTPPTDLKELAQQFPRLEKILNNPELDSVYKDFLVAYERGGVEAAELLARQRGLLTSDNQIRVTLVLDTQDSAALVAQLESLGVIVRGTYRDLIDIGIPLELIMQTAQSDNPGQVFDQITELEHVTGLQLPAPGTPNQASATPSPIEPAISEGVKLIGADEWQRAGYTGKGVKIGVLDQGFDGYRDRLGRDLPFNTQAQSFVPGIAVDATGINHGTAVAEIIHDVAPDAQIYLAYYDGGDVSMGNAVEWLLAQGVKIISHSAGGLAAPMDGTGRDDELVQRATEAGVLWVNSAGNNALQHYRGTYTDTDNDQVHEFAPGKTLLGFRAVPDSTTQIVLSWNDWQLDGDQDLDLFLLDRDGNTLASSRNSRGNHRPPVEQIAYQFDDADTYFVAIHGVNVTRPLSLSLFVHETPLLELADPIGSIATPGDSADAVTVGAVDWHNMQLEPFSSRGPTADGRIKPDLVGPDGVSNVTYPTTGFFGTSAAAPHIAGAAALVWSAYPAAQVADIRTYLLGSAIDLLEPGADNETGLGVMILPAAPPTPTPVPPTLTPEPGKPTSTPQPTATTHPIVIATPVRIRLQPVPVAPASSNGSGGGLILLGLGIVLGGIAGWWMMRHAHRPATTLPDRSGATPLVARSACAYCRYRYPPEAIYCPQCGRPIDADKAVRCAHCRRPLPGGAAFCSHCGQAAP
jgi:subtilisin family serine protease